jgi:hypothetical protein
MKPSSLQNLITRDRIIGLIFLVLGFLGLLYTVFGEFSEGAGIGAHLLPRLSFLIILAAGISLLLDKGESYQPQGDLATVSVQSVLLFVGMGLIYFLLVRRLGLIVSTLLYSLGVFSLLTVDPFKHWKQIVLPGIFITLLVWIAFTRVLSIVLPDPLLF